MARSLWGFTFDSEARAKQGQFQLECDGAPNYLRDAPLFRVERQLGPSRDSPVSPKKVHHFLQELRIIDCQLQFLLAARRARR